MSVYLGNPVLCIFKKIIFMVGRGGSRLGLNPSKVLCICPGKIVLRFFELIRYYNKYLEEILEV